MNDEEAQIAKAFALLNDSGDGSGRGRRTSLNWGSGDSKFKRMDRTGLESPPQWFSGIAPLFCFIYKLEFQKLERVPAIKLLSKHGIPPIYRLALGLRWKFLNKNEIDPSFSEFDFEQMMMPQSADDRPIGYHFDVKRELDAIELRSAFQIFQFRHSQIIANVNASAKAKSLTKGIYPPQD